MENTLQDKVKKFIQKWKSDKTNPSRSKGKLSFFQWMVIIVCLGLAAMIMQNYFSLQHELNTIPSVNTLETDDSLEAIGKVNDEPKTIEEYEQWYENQLTDILSNIVGVGEVSVMVNLESTEEVVVEKDIKTQASKTNEQDREGGSREIEDRLKDEKVVILRQGNDDQPVILMMKKPQVRGVLVVAKGAENAQVKAWITEAVQRVLNVSANRVSVLPKKS